MKDKPGVGYIAGTAGVCVCVRGGEGVGVAERKVFNLDDPNQSIYNDHFGQ